MDTRLSNKSQSFWYEVLDFVKSLIILLGIYFIIKTYIAQPFIVKGRSMEENFKDGDYVVVDELSYRFRDPERFEVVVFRTDFIPGNSKGDYYIKRVIALPGERVIIDQGKVLVFNDSNPTGMILDEPYLSRNTKTHTPQPVDVTLGEGEYFVMGDHRDNSSDSRYWGALGEEYIVGKPFVRLLPLDNVTLYTDQTFLQMAK